MALASDCTFLANYFLQAFRLSLSRLRLGRKTSLKSRPSMITLYAALADHHKGPFDLSYPEPQSVPQQHKAQRSDHRALSLLKLYT